MTSCPDGRGRSGRTRWVIRYGSRGDGAVNERILGATTGNTARVRNTLDAATRRLTTTQVDTKLSTTPTGWVDRSTSEYAYDQVGNITSIAGKADGVRDQVECFRYDHLRRMTDAWTEANLSCATPQRAGADPYRFSWTYDAVGNRTTQTSHSATGTTTATSTYPTAGGPQPHSLTSVAYTGEVTRTDTYDYDDAGNTTTRVVDGVTQTLTWDAEGHLATTSQSGQNTSYVYDAGGNRLLRKDATGTTLYVGETELRLTTSNGQVDGTRYYSHGAAPVAVRTVTGLTRLVGNHQATGTLAIDTGAGATIPVTRRRTMPFGEPRGTQPSSWPGERGFVGGTSDPTGLTHLGAREYDPTTGRFISVDPVQDLTDPQQWHGYAYANNNPITFSDPSGLAYCEDSDCSSTVKPPKAPGQDDGESGGRDPDRDGGGGDSGPEKERQEEIKKAKKIIVAAATGLAKIAMDELGITDALNCLTKGDIQGCLNTAIDVATSFVGGLLAKFARKYLFRFKHALKVGGKVKGLLGDLVEGIQKLRKATDCNSFLPGTLVLMADGSRKPIEELEVGDMVVATDPETGQSAGKAVVATIVGQGQKSLVEVTIDLDGEAGGKTGTVVATDGHPFWVPQLGEWLPASALTAGQMLQTAAGTWVQITALKHWTQPTRVHNLTVADIHTYYVLAGNTPILVHNCGGARFAVGSDGVAVDLDAVLDKTFSLANTPEKLAHVIDPAKHGFGDLVKRAGGRSEAMRSIVNSLRCTCDLPATGPFEVQRVIHGETVTIRGAIVAGVPRIGTAFIRSKFPGAGR